MLSTHWQFTAKNAFLASRQPEQLWQETLAYLPSPYLKITELVTKNQPLSLILPKMTLNLNVPASLELNDCDPSVLEMLFTIFGYLASGWVGLGHRQIPEMISLPLVELAEKVHRPPMLSYAGMVLNNWRLKDVSQGFIPKNIDLLLRFTDLIDERWFFQVHVAIEGQAGSMLQAMVDVQSAIADDEQNQVLVHLRKMQAGLVQITKTFHEMPKLCDPDIYFQEVRPYLMSFGKEIVFEGVADNPTPLRGGSGAQSSIVPAMLAGLGIAHQESELTSNLADMRPYMPREHRAFISELQKSRLRAYCEVHAPLRDAYNHVLRQLITFRRAHLYYARTYIFEKSTNPIGTGGTEYMSFLSQLIDETAEQLL